jgi:hypothetical protein
MRVCWRLGLNARFYWIERWIGICGGLLIADTQKK